MQAPRLCLLQEEVERSALAVKLGQDGKLMMLLGL
jgi:hypothetical protein